MSSQLRRRPDQQACEWLPNLQVWARIPKQGMADSAALQQPPQQMQLLPEPQLAAHAAASPASPVTYTGYRLGQEADSDCEIVEDGGSEGGLPVCPVCLCEIFDAREKAVVIACMHVFCLACLSRWSALNKSCPLCKSRIQGYMHNILSDTEYSQRMLPATPPRRAKSPPSPLSPRGRGSDLGRAIIDFDPPRSPRDAHRGHRSTSSSGGSRREALSRSTNAFRRGRHDLGGEWVPGMWPPVRAPRRPSVLSAATPREPLREPRPYFYRVQAQAQSQARGGPLAGRGSAADAAADPALLQDAALAWRRHIYVQGLYAQPLDDAALGGLPPPQSVHSAERRAQRLQAWVERDLRALLQSEDTSIVRAYVMGLVRGIGFPAASSSQPHSRSTGTDAARGQGGGAAAERGDQDAVAALRPFLQERAGHFWHELRCFAGVALSMQTYDRLVQHRRPAQPAPTAQQPEAADAEHASRPASPGSQAADASRAVGTPEPEEDHREDPDHARRRVRRRFSDGPPSEAPESAGGADPPARHVGTGREKRAGTSRRRRHWSPHDRQHRKERLDVRAARGVREGGAGHAHVVASRAGAGSGVEECGAVARGTANVLAELRARAFAELQARRQA